MVGSFALWQPIIFDPGDWAGAAAAPMCTYELCDSAGENCESPWRTAFECRVVDPRSTYLGPEEVGRRLRLEVVVTNAHGSTSAVALSDVVVSAPPRVELAHADWPVEGNSPAIEGRTVESSGGHWLALPGVFFARQWYRCDSNGDNCLAIEGEIAATYVTRTEDVGHTVRSRVYATDGFGTTSVFGRGPLPVVAKAPANTTPPLLSGSGVAGEPLSTSAGTWSGTGTISYLFRWERCSSACSSCVVIPEQTSPTYTPSTALIGAGVRAVARAFIGNEFADAASACTTVSAP
jgi:hypothetical protein